MISNELPFVSILIPMRNEEKYIDGCLKNILDQDYPKDKREIIVIDGKSEDSCAEIVQSYVMKDSSISLFRNQKGIVPSSMNIGIKASKGEIIIRIDAHSLYDKDYVSNCVSLLIESKADNVGGPMRAIGEKPIQNAIAYATSTSFGVGNSFFHFENFEGYADSVYLGCYWKKSLIELGLYDEELVRNQDDELNYRLTQRGGRIYCSPRIKSYYYPRDSLRKLFKQYYQYGFWKVRVIQKQGRVPSIRHLAPFALVLGFLLFFILNAVNPLLDFSLFKVTMFFYPLFLLYFILMAFYVVSSLGKMNYKSCQYLFLVYPTIHFSYGIGFAVGLWSFRKLWKKDK